MKHKIKELEEKGLLRELKNLKQNGVFIEYGGKEYINLSSNDYLGISANKKLQEEFFNTLDKNTFIMGALSSRLLTGNNAVTEELESYLSVLYGKECLLFNSGYHANIGILPAITEKGDLIIADKLIHASIIDGIMLCKCEYKRFKHNDYNDLERILEQSKGKYKNTFIVTESIFSMDGDTVDIEKLVELKERFNAKLYIDEAHAFGIAGKQGLGIVHSKNLINKTDFTVCTLGKAVASEGAFVICGSVYKQWLVNKARTLIFTTATPPVNILWSLFIIKKITGMEKEREHLAMLTELLRDKIKDCGLLGNTHIIPILTGDNDKCIRFARRLQSKGLWVMPIRYPSVPAGQTRVRLSLTAAMTIQQIQRVYESILA